MQYQQVEKDETKDSNHGLQRLNFQGHEQSSQTINKIQELYANQEHPIKWKWHTRNDKWHLTAKFEHKEN